MNSAQEDDYLTVAEIAARFKINPQTVRNWISKINSERYASVRAASASCALISIASWPPPALRRSPTHLRTNVPPSIAMRSWPQHCSAGAALAADRKTDLAIALHTLVAAAEPFLDTGASHEDQSDAEDQASEAPPAND